MEKYIIIAKIKSKRIYKASEDSLAKALLHINGILQFEKEIIDWKIFKQKSPIETFKYY